ncbi:hypothetical protein GCM10023322_00880 [Rugosimonospora acidiphila]|uniref:Uncharacterized protein n=1 Tax=Rugosimonospora acidiphila TaxID=556531 RepID=A0ABP9RHW6_9ACTN
MPDHIFFGSAPKGPSCERWAGTNVGIVNPMTMDFGSSREWGDAVIAAANSTLTQMAAIWPDLTSAALHRMLGVTPMIGRITTPARSSASRTGRSWFTGIFGGFTG